MKIKAYPGDLGRLCITTERARGSLSCNEAKQHKQGIQPGAGRGPAGPAQAGAAWQGACVI